VPYTALVSLAAVMLIVFLGTRVAKARRAFDIQLPAVAGHPEFERINRVHMNTLEWLPVFIVPLWLFAFYISDRWAAVLGVVWIAGRIIYWLGYTQAADKRYPGFLIQGLAVLALLLGALYGVVARIIAG
jgi:glutathione S-transferase